MLAILFFAFYFIGIPLLVGLNVSLFAGFCTFGVCFLASMVLFFPLLLSICGDRDTKAKRIGMIVLKILGVLFALAAIVTLLFELFPDRYAIVAFLIYCGAAAFLFMVSMALMYLCRVYADREEHYIRYRIFSALWVVLVAVSLPVSVPLLAIEDKFEHLYLSWHERDIKACKEIVQEIYCAINRGDREKADSLYNEYFR